MSLDTQNRYSTRPQVKFAALFLSFLMSLAANQPTDAIGIVSARPITMVGVHVRQVKKAQPAPTVRQSRGSSSARAVAHQASRVSKTASARKAHKKPTVAHLSRPIPPQNFSESLAQETIAPGVVHKFCRGPLNINVIDVDMQNAPVKVQPYMAGETFDRLKDVADHAKEARAIAAVNANYFKKNGTPLGTLIVDGEWVSGPLYDRVSMGITRSGFVRIDRVNLGGTLTTNNPEVPGIWVNNINQPRRHGCHLVAYTRRWGSFVKLPYEGCLVAVDAQGKVMDKSLTSMGIPWGGYVLTDSKDSTISKLERGDAVQIQWKTAPSEWQDVVEAVSGGPMLIKDGQVYLDLKDENFRRGWTGAQIHARTAAGITANNHLLLVTVEGPHTLWDLAKFMHKLGAMDAMNLDGGGSTTMVINGATVTRNAKASQRRVASSIVVLDLRKTVPPERTVNAAFRNGVAPSPLPEVQTSAPALGITSEANGEHNGLAPAAAADVQAILTTPAPSTTTVEVSKEPSLFSENSESISASKRKHKRWWHVLPTNILP